MSVTDRTYKTHEYMILCKKCKMPFIVCCAHGKTNTRIFCDDCMKEKIRTYYREKYRRNHK